MTKLSGFVKVRAICLVFCCVSISVTIISAKKQDQQPKEKHVVTVLTPQPELPVPFNERYVLGKVIRYMHRPIHMRGLVASPSSSVVSSCGNHVLGGTEYYMCLSHSLVAHTLRVSMFRAYRESALLRVGISKQNTGSKTDRITCAVPVLLLLLFSLTVITVNTLEKRAQF